MSCKITEVDPLKRRKERRKGKRKEKKKEKTQKAGDLFYLQRKLSVVHDP